MGNDMKQEVFLADGYSPAEDEPFMNDRQVEYFRRKLLNWKAELLASMPTEMGPTVATASFSLSSLPYGNIIAP